jgi:hypothetical protein
MTTFSASPFSLSIGDEIVAIVYATNALGSGSVSLESTTNALVETVPL